MESPYVRLLLCAAAFLVLAAAPARAAAAPIELSTCGTTISEQGDYVLTQDIGPCPGTGIAVAVGFVRLWLAGHTITGVSSATACDPNQPQFGIDIQPGTSSVLVYGGTVSHFTNGVNVAGSFAQVRSTRLLENCITGAAIAGDAATVERVEARGSRFGIFVCASYANIVGSDISGNREFGVELACSTSNNGVGGGNRLVGNGSASGGGGVHVSGGTDNQIGGNTLQANFDGVVLAGGQFNQVGWNEFDGNTNSGLTVGSGVTDTRIDFNVAYGNRVDLSEANACGVNHFEMNDYAVGVGCVQ